MSERTRIHYIFKENTNAEELATELYEEITTLAAADDRLDTKEYSNSEYAKSYTSHINELLVGFRSYSDRTDHFETEYLAPDVPHLELEVEEKRLDIETDQRINDLFEMITLIYDGLSQQPEVVLGLPGWTAANLYSEPTTRPITTADDGTATLEYIPWFVIFPPSRIDDIGRERLLEAPASRIVHLDDGALLLAAYDDPRDPTGIEQFNNHLGFDDPWEWY